MKIMLDSLKKSLKLLWNDKILLLLAAIPIAIGVTLYSVAGHWVVTRLTSWGRGYIDGHIQNQNLGPVLYYLFLGIMGLLLFFIVNWTFFLVVSVLSAPINDVISARVEKHLVGVTSSDQPFSWELVFINGPRLVINELKKISLIFVLTILSTLLSFFPVMGPVSFFINANLMSIQFLDYSWSRNKLKASECVKDHVRGILEYSLSGMVFTIFMTVPILNLFFISLAVIYYTILWNTKKSLKS